MVLDGNEEISGTLSEVFSNRQIDHDARRSGAIGLEKKNEAQRERIPQESGMAAIFERYVSRKRRERGVISPYDQS